MIARMYSYERTCTTINNAVNISMTLVCAVPQVYLEWLGHKALRDPLDPGGMLDHQVCKSCATEHSSHPQSVRI